MKQTKKNIGAKLQNRTNNKICTIISIDVDGFTVQYEDNNKIQFYKNNTLNSKFTLYEKTKENTNLIQTNILNDSKNKEIIDTDNLDTTTQKSPNEDTLTLSNLNNNIPQGQYNQLLAENERLKNEITELKTTISELKNKKHPGGRPSRFKNEEINKIIEYHKQGESYRKIAKEFNCSSAYIHKLIKADKDKTINKTNHRTEKD